jgi:hypothetical protein
MDVLREGASNKGSGVNLRASSGGLAWIRDEAGFAGM